MDHQRSNEYDHDVVHKIHLYTIDHVQIYVYEDH